MSPSSGTPSGNTWSVTTALLWVVILCALEIVSLFLLLTVESPLSPLVRRFTQTPAGLIALVALLASILAFLQACVYQAGVRIRNAARDRRAAADE